MWNKNAKRNKNCVYSSHAFHCICVWSRVLGMTSSSRKKKDKINKKKKLKKKNETENKPHPVYTTLYDVFSPITTFSASLYDPKHTTIHTSGVYTKNDCIPFTPTRFQITVFQCHPSNQHNQKHSNIQLSWRLKLKCLLKVFINSSFRSSLKPKTRTTQHTVQVQLVRSLNVNKRTFEWLYKTQSFCW